MSTAAGPIIAEPAPAPPGPPLPPAPRRRGAGPWARVALACAVLAAAGAARAWQGRRVERAMAAGRSSPFALEELPRTVGPWTTTEDRVLDPAIARGAGSTASINRTYTDDRTGVQLGVLVLYGPALQMHIHAPEVCYPAAGYAQAEGPVFRRIAYRLRDGTARAATVAALTYTKGEGPAAERKQVFYTWGYNGEWTPVLKSPKEFQRVPGMFKVHLDRRVGPGESLEGRRVGPGEPPPAENPGEALLKALLPELDERMRRPPPGPAASPSAAATATAAAATR